MVLTVRFAPHIIGDSGLTAVTALGIQKLPGQEEEQARSVLHLLKSLPNAVKGWAERTMERMRLDASQTRPPRCTGGTFTKPPGTEAGTFLEETGICSNCGKPWSEH